MISTGQVSIDDPFAECGKTFSSGWGPQENAGALYELTANHLIALRENDALDCGLQAPRAGADTVSSSYDAAHAIATGIQLQNGQAQRGQR